MGRRDSKIFCDRHGGEYLSRDGGTRRRSRFKIRRTPARGGSTPSRHQSNEQPKGKSAEGGILEGVRSLFVRHLP